MWLNIWDSAFKASHPDFNVEKQPEEHIENARIERGQWEAALNGMPPFFSQYAPCQHAVKEAEMELK